MRTVSSIFYLSILLHTIHLQSIFIYKINCIYGDLQKWKWFIQYQRHYLFPHRSHQYIVVIGNCWRSEKQKRWPKKKSKIVLFSFDIAWPIRKCAICNFISLFNSVYSCHDEGLKFFFFSLSLSSSLILYTFFFTNTSAWHDSNLKINT